MAGAEVFSLEPLVANCPELVAKFGMPLDHLVSPLVTDRSTIPTERGPPAMPTAEAELIRGPAPHIRPQVPPLAIAPPPSSSPCPWPFPFSRP